MTILYVHETILHAIVLYSLNLAIIYIVTTANTEYNSACIARTLVEYLYVMC